MITGGAYPGAAAKLGLVRGRLGFPATLAAVLGLALVALGVVYLSVACQSLPGFMGPVRGDTAPRSGFGIVALVLGLGALGAAALSAWRREAPPSD